MRIRPALPSDSLQIAQVHIQSWRETYPGIVPMEILQNLDQGSREEAWRQHLQEGNPARFSFVAQDEAGNLAGFCAGGPLRRDLPAGELPNDERLKNIEGELQAIYLLKSEQGKGIGRKLYDVVVSELKRRGHKSMLARVLKENKTRGFYERMGGREVLEAKILIGIELPEIVYVWDKI